MCRMALFSFKASSTKESGHFRGLPRTTVWYTGRCKAPRRRGRRCAFFEGFLYCFVYLQLPEESLGLFGIPTVTTM